MIIEDLINDEKKEIALRTLKIGRLSNEEIAICSGFTLEQIEELEKLQPV